MKKIVLSVLLLTAATATSAFAQTDPLQTYPPHAYPLNKIYFCYYYNYSGPAKNPGLSWWEKRPVGSTPELLYTNEHYQKPNSTWDGFRATWSYPRTNRYGITTWDFRIKDGPFCTNATVTPGGYTISIQGCSDGHTRSCYAE